MEQSTSEKLIPNWLIYQVLYMQKEQQKYDPNLQITWLNLYVNVYMPSCYSYLHYHRQCSRAISKGTNLDCGIGPKQYFLLFSEGLSNINHASPIIVRLAVSSRMGPIQGGYTAVGISAEAAALRME